ncbi:YggT family protein [bacterium]|nr:YggT family protein [bacterium]
MARLIDLVFNIIYLALVARIILSWVPHDPFHPVITLIGQITDPVLRPFQRLIPPLAGFDLSPMFAFFALEVGKTVLLNLLF